MTSTPTIVATERGTREEMGNLIRYLLTVQALPPDEVERIRFGSVMVELPLAGENEPAIIHATDNLSETHREILKTIVDHFRPFAAPSDDCIRLQALGASRILYLAPDAIGGHEALEAHDALIAFLMARGRTRQLAELMVRS